MLVKILLAFLILSSWTAAMAGDGDQAMRDSLLTLADTEQTLQDIFDSLGYDIDVVNDELGWEEFCAPSGLNMAVLIQELSTSYYSASAGWYYADDSLSKTELFGPDDLADDSVTFATSGTGNVGFYFIPGISGGYTWYTDPSYNRDLFDHAKVFASKQNPLEYLIAFEDLKNGGDQDFNDLIIKVRFVAGEPVVDLGEDVYANVCYAEDYCFEINAHDGNCAGDMLTLEMIEGPGWFTPVTGTSPLTATHCFMPDYYDSEYTLVFKVTDNLGMVGYDTLVITYDMNSPPTLWVPADFDTMICEGKEVCFTVSGSDDDDDDLIFELLYGPGDIDPVTGEVCFFPDAVDSADYMFVIRASDSCCIKKDEECGLDPDCPYGCPKDTVIVTVLLTELPYFVEVPAIDTTLCEPATICFPVSASSPGGRPMTIEVEPPATYNDQTGEACLYVDTEGVHEVILTVSDDECGVGDIDTATITVDLNSPPTVTLPNDTTLAVCEQSEYCFFAVGYDPDGDDLTYVLESGPGTINPVTGEICFTPTGSDQYEFIVSVTDICAIDDVDTTVVTVVQNTPPTVSVPDTTLAACEVGEVCFTVDAYDPDAGDDLTYELLSGMGSIDPSTGEICFTPPGEGTYPFSVKVIDQCGNEDVDDGSVTISLNKSPVIMLPEVDTLYWCELGDSVCFAVNASDPDLDQDIIIEQLSGPEGSLDSETGEFCFLPSVAGAYFFEFRVVDPCLAADTAETEVVIVVNTDPDVTLPADYSVNLCDPTQICVPVTIADDGEVDVVIIPAAAYSNGEFCFMATRDSVYCFTVTVTDTCGMVDSDDICITVEMNDYPSLTLGPAEEQYVCEPGDTVCFPYTVSDPDGEIPTISLFVGKGEVRDGEICFAADSAGTYYFVVRATDHCGDYVARDISVIVEMNNPPELIPQADTAYLLCGPEQICFDNDATDPDPMDNLTFMLISGAGVIFPETGVVCFTPPSAGAYKFVIRVKDDCGSYDQDTVNIDVVFNSPPSITGENQQLQVNYCEVITDPGERCFFGIEVYDPDSQDELTVEKRSGPGVFYEGTLQTCFTPEPFDSTYEFCYRVTDLCGDFDEVCINVDVTFEDSCDVDTASCLVVSLENEIECVYNSQEFIYNIYIESFEQVGGFDLLIEYDVTGFTFITARIGPALTGWEYFTFRYGPTDNCGGPCPDGLIRFVGIADINNGAYHPPIEAFSPSGSMIQITFRATSDVNFGGMFFPVRFFWIDCGDNSFSSMGGDTLFVDKLILGPNGVVWDEFDDLNYPESIRQRNVGAPDSCIVGGKTDPQRCVVFENGGICIISPDSIDLRGDINLNDVANEIADVVLFTNYFIWGIGVFNINQEGQIAATDVNADGQTLTVGDLVYLIRILTGDALPINKLSPYAESIDISTDRSDGQYEVRSSSSAEVGAGYLVFDYNPDKVTPGTPVISSDASNMTVSYSVQNGTMKVLIYSASKQGIGAGDRVLVSIPTDGDGEIELVHSEFADYHSNQLMVNMKSEVTRPEGFRLTQNYPNPFNPETEFELYLPKPSDWEVQIFNVQGQIVKTLSGYADGGMVSVRWNATDDNDRKVASGIYFYRAQAGDYSETKKMVLLK